MPHASDIAEDASHLPHNCARCERCKALSTDLDGGLCCSCRRDLFEQLVGPKIDWLFGILGNSVELAEIDRLQEVWSSDYGPLKGDAGTPTWISPQTKEQYGRPNDPQRQIQSEVEKWRDRWSPLRAWERRYVEVANRVDPKVEFLYLIQAAITSRRFYRHHLRNRFGMAHPRRRRFLRDGPRLQNEDECTVLESVLDLFDLSDAMLHVGLDAIFPFWRDGQLHMAIPMAAREMRRVLLEGLPLTVALDLNRAVAAGDAVKQERCLFRLSGWMASQISLSRNLRLQKALSKDGTSAEVALLQRLPAQVLTAWRDSAFDEDLSLLRSKVVNSIELDAPQRQPRPSSGHGVVRPEAIHLAQQIEAQDELVAWIKRAGLTAIEEAVTHLQLRDYTDQEIAEHLGRSEGSVKQAWLRARRKLGRIASR